MAAKPFEVHEICGRASLLPPGQCPSCLHVIRQRLTEEAAAMYSIILDADVIVRKYGQAADAPWLTSVGELFDRVEGRA